MKSEEHVFEGPSFDIFRDAMFFLFLFLISLLLTFVLVHIFHLPPLPAVLWLIFYGFTEMLLFIAIMRTYRGCLKGEYSKKMGVDCGKRAYMIVVKIGNSNLEYVKKIGQSEKKTKIPIEGIMDVKISRGSIYVRTLESNGYSLLGRIPHLDSKDRKEMMAVLKSIKRRGDNF